jgi:hypothetical protein
MIRHHVERLRAKPEHIRRRIAMGTSVGITGLVAGVWFVGILFSGKLTLAVPVIGGPSSTFADSGTGVPVPDVGAAAANTGNAFTQLLGAVGVATATTAPAALIVEDKVPTTTPTVQKNSQGQTVIPF